jgi:glycosyltransferase involved in cell wall biosynthesis
MRIVIEVTAEDRPGKDRGIGRYLNEVRMANQMLANEVQDLVIPVPDGRLGELRAIPARRRALHRMTFDVFHAPTAYYATITGRGVPQVVSILDLIPLELPAHQRTGIKAQFVHRIGAKAGAILTLSEHSACRIEAVLGVRRERIFVAPLPVGPEFRPDGTRFDAGGRRYVTAMIDTRVADPRKRSDWLRLMAPSLRQMGLTLVLVGDGTQTWTSKSDGILGLGRIDDRAWAEVLRGAKAFVFPSAYEGQGLPPLEAISCGTPVVAASNTALPEVVGPAGILVPDVDVEGDPSRVIRSMIAAVEGLLSEPGMRERLVRATVDQAARFHSARFRDQVDSAYRYAVEVGS